MTPCRSFVPQVDRAARNSIAHLASADTRCILPAAPMNDVLRPRAAGPCIALLSALVLASPPVRAQTARVAAQTAVAPPPPRVSRGEIDGDILGYYGGERTAAFVVMGLSVAAVGTGAVLVTRETDFARGLGWPLLTLGALEGVGAVIYAFTVGAQTDHYRGLLARDPAAFHREESEHIRGTTSRFVIYRLTELGLAVAGAGVATYGFASGQDVWKGVGIGVAALALPFFVIDTVNQARAGYYQDRLRRFDSALALAVDPAGGATSLSLGGRF
jgi:hypothetical protein